VVKILPSGIDTKCFSAHYVRGAAASQAARAGVTISDIMAAADWASENTFQRFYFRPTHGVCQLGSLQTYMLILRLSLPICNYVFVCEPYM
jgi:hypothetical protein